MRWPRTWCIFVVAMAAVACSSSTEPKVGTPVTDVFLPRALTSNEQTALQASNTFGFSLFAKINTATRTENQFISPLSASMALAMVANGAASTTWTEMRSTLGLGAATQTEMRASYHDLIAVLRALDPKVDFRIANALWVSTFYGPAIDPTYLSQTQQAFDARVGSLDFSKAASVDTVNSWANAATAGKIPTIVQSLDPSLVMLLANAIYFKGDWRTTFSVSGTHLETFTLLDGSKTSVPMMHRSGTMRYGNLDGRQLVELGYGGDAFVMDVVKPKTGESVNDLAESLSVTMWNGGIATLTDMPVDLAMPRFKLDWERTLNADLIAMGMPTAFTAAADFTAASPTMGRQMFISFVKQKTFVDVNETGTVAAAVTAVGVTAVSGTLNPPVSVTFDRPFVFVIRERITGAILFMGKVVRPV